MDRRLTRLSKFLSYILRHHPEDLGLTPDQAGWIVVDDLIAAAHRHGHSISREAILRIMAESEQSRFALTEDAKYIRATYGHSIQVDLGYRPQQPPAVLFHGTARRFLDAIRRQGLTARQRQFVHLSENRTAAEAVGRRHGTPVILTVRAGQMNRDGFVFYQSDAGLWLTNRIPVSYIRFPGDREEPG